MSNLSKRLLSSLFRHKCPLEKELAASHDVGKTPSEAAVAPALGGGGPDTDRFPGGMGAAAGDLWMRVGDLRDWFCPCFPQEETWVLF